MTQYKRVGCLVYRYYRNDLFEFICGTENEAQAEYVVNLLNVYEDKNLVEEEV